MDCNFDLISRDNPGVIIFELSGYDIMCKGVDQPGLPLGPVPGPLDGVLREELSRVRRVLAIEGLDFFLAEVSECERFLYYVERTGQSCGLSFWPDPVFIVPLVPLSHKRHRPREHSLRGIVTF
jgi:hypothetical protein